MKKPRRVAMMLELKWPLKWHAEVFAGAQRYADQHNWDTVIDDFVTETLLEHPQPASLYDGVLGRITPELAALGERLRLPIVNTWMNSPAADRLPGVFPDSIANAKIAAEHLLARGLRQFAVLSHSEKSQQINTVAVRETVQAAGYPCTVLQIPITLHNTYAARKKTEQQIMNWMKDWKPPIGVIIWDEAWGRLVVQLSHQRGWHVPKDVAIIAGANDVLFCNNPRPSLTSMDIGYMRIGYEAAGLLDQLMDQRAQESRKKKTTAEPMHLYLPPVGLVVRESTDFYSVGHPLVAQALQFIATNSHREIDCDVVARSLAVHPRTLRRRFDECVSWTIADEIRRVRVEHAKRLLTEPDRDLAEIAKAVGFESRTRLYDAFLRHAGITPSEFRKQHKLN